MFFKHTFLGVANATSAKAVAGIATSAKMTGAVKKFTAFTAMALVAFGLTACGGGSSEEKETCTPSSNDKAAASENGWDLAVPKSYVREKKADTLPPFIVLMGNDIAGSSFGFDKNGDEILNIKATNKNGEDCRAGYQGDESGGFGALRECGPNEVATIEVTTKSSGKVTYKF